MIKAIETQYKGYRFRSRLEARWAVFFDALGIKYKYEEFGFEKCIENNNYMWLPDFYLPDFGAWVEVKGGNVTAQDAEKMASILDWGSPLPFFDHSFSKGICEQEVDLFVSMGGKLLSSWAACPGVLLLGDIPEIRHGLVLHSFVTHNKGLKKGLVRFFGKSICKVSHEEMEIIEHFTGVALTTACDFIDGYAGTTEDAKDFFSPRTFAFETNLANISLCKAYQAARSARFEHGECGALP